jgi:hypothetical protein
LLPLQQGATVALCHGSRLAWANLLTTGATAHFDQPTKSTQGQPSITHLRRIIRAANANRCHGGIDTILLTPLFADQAGDRPKTAFDQGEYSPIIATGFTVLHNKPKIFDPETGRRLQRQARAIKKAQLHTSACRINRIAYEKLTAAHDLPRWSILCHNHCRTGNKHDGTSALSKTGRGKCGTKNASKQTNQFHPADFHSPSQKTQRPLFASRTPNNCA